MFASFGRSFRLAKESFYVLRQDPELLLLTAASFISVVIVGLITGAIGFGSGLFESGGGEEWEIDSLGFLILGLGYFVGYFFVIYFQVALVCAIQLRMSGGDPNVWYGLIRANHRLGAIMSWTLIAATVGLLLRLLEGAARGRNGGGQMVSVVILRLLGVGWALLVFFVVPVIAAEGTGGFSAIRRSSSIVKQRWGEAVIGNSGMGLFTGVLIAIGSGIPLAIGLMSLQGSSVGNVMVGSVLVAIAIAIGLFIMVLSASLNSTYRAVLYSYAVTGKSIGFLKETLDNAFVSKDDQ
jgi:hypothetical protein